MMMMMMMMMLHDHAGAASVIIYINMARVMRKLRDLHHALAAADSNNTRLCYCPNSSSAVPSVL
jgi:hypothetical protein